MEAQEAQGRLAAKERERVLLDSRIPPPLEKYSFTRRCIYSNDETHENFLNNKKRKKIEI